MFHFFMMLQKSSRQVCSHTRHIQAKHHSKVSTHQVLPPVYQSHSSHKPVKQSKFGSNVHASFLHGIEVFRLSLLDHILHIITSIRCSRFLRGPSLMCTLCNDLHIPSGHPQTAGKQNRRRRRPREVRQNPLAPDGCMMSIIHKCILIILSMKISFKIQIRQYFKEHLASVRAHWREG